MLLEDITGIVIAVYLIFGSSAVGYALLRLGWPGIAGIERAYKIGWSLIAGLVFSLIVVIAAAGTFFYAGTGIALYVLLIFYSVCAFLIGLTAVTVRRVAYTFILKGLPEKVMSVPKEVVIATKIAELVVGKLEPAAPREVAMEKTPAIEEAGKAKPERELEELEEIAGEKMEVPLEERPKEIRPKKIVEPSIEIETSEKYLKKMEEKPPKEEKVIKEKKETLSDETEEELKKLKKLLTKEEEEKDV